jgi:iron(III) transport system permease protein
MKSAQIPIILSFLFLIVFIIPIFYLVYGSTFFHFYQGAPTLTWQNFLQLTFSATTGSLLINTMVFAIGGAVMATILAFIYAWIIIRTDVPGKRVWELLPILPLTMPLLVKAFAWMYLFSPQNGIMNILFNNLTGLGSIFNIFSMPGLIFAIGTGGIPIAYLTIEAAVKSLNPALEEASRVAGNGILKTLFRVTIPVLLPAIFSSFLLLLIIGMTNFDYPYMLGRYAGIDTLASQVFLVTHEFQPPRYGDAVIYSVIFIVITLAVVFIYIYATRQAYKFVVVTGKAPRETLHRLRRWKYVALLVLFFIMFFAFLLPFSTLVLMSFTPFLTTVGGIHLYFTTANYINAINLPGFSTAMTNTIFLGLISGIVGTLLAALMAYASLKSKVRGAKLVDVITSVPMAFPGIVYGLAIFWTFLLLPGVSSVIYGTIWPLVIALVFIRLPYSVRMVSSSLIQISDELEESSRVSGASWGRTFYKIVLPLMRRGMVNSFVYTFVNSLREVGAVVFLATGNSIVIMTLLLQLQSQNALSLNLLAATSVILSVFIMIALALSSIAQASAKQRRERIPKS